MRFLGGGSSYYSAEPVGHSGKCFLIPNTDIITVYKTFLAVSCRVSRPGILVLVRIFGPRKTPHAAATNSESLVSGRTINGVYGAAKRKNPRCVAYTRLVRVHQPPCFVCSDDLVLFHLDQKASPWRYLTSIFKQSNPPPITIVDRSLLCTVPKPLVESARRVYHTWSVH